MNNAHHRRSKSELLLSFLPTLLISDATGVLGLLIYRDNHSTLVRSGTLLALSISHFVINLSLPLAFINSRYSTAGITSILLISSLLILGAGLSYLNLSLFQNNGYESIHNQTLFQTFNSLLLVSLLCVGTSLGYVIKCLNIEIPSTIDVDSQENSIIEKPYLSDTQERRNVVSLKASAATLVDPHRRSVDDNNLSIFSSISNLNSRVSGTVKRSSTTNQVSSGHIVDCSIKKLSTINQSTSSTDIISTSNEFSGRKSTSMYSSATPVLNRVMDMQQPSKNLLNERDAIKRIPSVLLPPHLRPQEKKTTFSNFPMSQEQTPKLRSPATFQSECSHISHSQSFSDYRRDSIPEEGIIEQIPRSITVQELMLGRPDPSKVGLRTISLEDWERRGEWLEQHEKFKTPSYSYLPYQGPSVYNKALIAEESDKFTLADIDADKIDSSLSDHGHSINPDSENSTEEALKYVENAQDVKGDFYEGGIDQSYSTLHLEEMYNDQSSVYRTKTHSPQKSMFRAHSQKSSVSSFTFKGFSASVPSSPKKRRRSNKSSPKKNIMKNHSLSSIVFKYDEEEAVPNFSYVHELQSSPSRRITSMINLENTKPGILETPTKAFKSESKKTGSPTTPESNHSNASFPSEVIGQYDKEKWKTLQRLNMVQNTTTRA